MKKRKMIALIFLTVALILETMPQGVKMAFAGGPDQISWETASYFSVLPFGYGNFGPLATAILSCVMEILGIICLIGEQEKILRIWKILAVSSVVTAAMPLFYGLGNLSGIGILILLAMVGVRLSLVWFPKGKADKNS